MINPATLHKPHAVYRFFGADGKLLYIGVTCSPFHHRFCDHFRFKPWNGDIRTITLTWFPNWEQGARAEAVAILEEAPLHNKRRLDPTTMRGSHAKVPGGDGNHCPCGAELPKGLRRKPTYCHACMAADRARRRLKARAEKV